MSRNPRSGPETRPTSPRFRCRPRAARRDRTQRWRRQFSTGTRVGSSWQNLLGGPHRTRSEPGWAIRNPEYRSAGTEESREQRFRPGTRAALFGRHVAQRLLDMTPAPRPRRLSTLLARHTLTHLANPERVRISLVSSRGASPRRTGREKRRRQQANRVYRPFAWREGGALPRGIAPPLLEWIETYV